MWVQERVIWEYQTSQFFSPKIKIENILVFMELVKFTKVTIYQQSYLKIWASHDPMQGSTPREQLVFCPVIWEIGILKAFLMSRALASDLHSSQWFGKWEGKIWLAPLCGEGLALWTQTHILISIGSIFCLDLWYHIGGMFLMNSACSQTSKSRKPNIRPLKKCVKLFCIFFL